MRKDWKLIFKCVTEWKSWKPGGPSVSLGQFGGQSRHPALAYLQPLDQPALPSSPKYLPSSQLQKGGQSLESCKSILEKAGKQNEPRREAAVSHTWPCLAWAPALPTVLTSWLTFSSGGFPDKRRCFLLGSSRAFQRALRCDSCRLLLNPIQTIIRINCVTPSLLWGTIMKRNSGPHLIPSTKLIKVVWDKFLL